MAATAFRTVSPGDRSIEVVGGVIEIPFLPYPDPDTAANWKVIGSSILMSLEVPAEADLISVVIPFPRITRGRITSISVWVNPAEAHVGLPPTMPAISLIGRVRASGANGLEESTNDESADVATYEALHELVHTVAGAALLSAEHFSVALRTEFGANALGAVAFSRLSATIVPE
jgi:hypothetical protein